MDILCLRHFQGIAFLFLRLFLEEFCPLVKAFLRGSWPFLRPFLKGFNEQMDHNKAKPKRCILNYSNVVPSHCVLRSLMAWIPL